jgi:hypothetical protein
MADTKITALAALAATPADGDLLTAVDVSDTTMAASGTNKKLAYSTLRDAINAPALVVAGSSSLTIDPTSHPHDCTILIVSNYASMGALTLPTLANQPAAGTRYHVVVDAGGTSETSAIVVNTADGNLPYDGYNYLYTVNDYGLATPVYVRLTYLGSNRWYAETKSQGNMIFTNVDPP